MTEQQQGLKMPVSVLIKPASGRCNMRCSYCFYTDEMCRREIPDYGVMTEEVLEIVLKKILCEAHGSCSIMFQGGEPTCAGLRYFRKAVELAHKWNVNHCRLMFSLQTNGYCLNAEWAGFLAENHFLVGLSLDGTPEIHNEYRKDAKGMGTFGKVMETVSLFDRYGVEYNILTVVTAATVQKISAVYRFFKKRHFGYLQFIECMDPMDDMPGSQIYSLTPEHYGEFLKQLFDLWHTDMEAGNYTYIRYFENLMLMTAGREPESCSMCGCCQRQFTVEADGSVYPCDFYVLDRWRLGNLCEDTVADIDRRRHKSGFVEWSMQIPEECRACKWYVLCRNGCRRSCETMADGKRGRNYYCRSFQEFFEYSYDRLRNLVQKLLEEDQSKS